MRLTGVATPPAMLARKRILIGEILRNDTPTETATAAAIVA